MVPDHQVRRCEPEAAHGERERNAHVLPIGEDHAISLQVAQGGRDVEGGAPPASRADLARNLRPVEEIDAVKRLEQQVLRPRAYSVCHLLPELSVGSRRNEHQCRLAAHLRKASAGARLGADFLDRIRAGTPTAVAPGGTSSMTTALAPIVQPSPSVIPPRMRAPAPTLTPSPRTGNSCVSRMPTVMAAMKLA